MEWYCLLPAKFFSFCHPICNVVSSRQRQQSGAQNVQSVAGARQQRCGERAESRWGSACGRFWALCTCPKSPIPRRRFCSEHSLQRPSCLPRCFLFLIWNSQLTCRCDITPIRQRAWWSILKGKRALSFVVAQIPLVPDAEPSWETSSYH